VEKKALSLFVVTLYNELSCRMVGARGETMDWITTKQAADEWGITVRRVQALCDNGQVNGATKLADMWVIPKGTQKPLDGRTKAARESKESNMHGGK
jgi:hypothetical protein